MNKGKIILAGICILAAAGGALAFKARATNGFIWNGSAYLARSVAENCIHIGEGCKYTSDDGSTFLFYTFDGTKNQLAKP